MKLRINNDCNLHYTNAYWVYQQGVQISNSPPTYLQQYMHLKAVGIENPNPQQALLDYPQAYISTIDINNYIVIDIDANKLIQDRLSTLLQFINTNQLLDLYGSTHKNNKFSTHINGSKQINYILCSKMFNNTSQKCEY
jgi:hypothetical protein